MRSFDHDRTNRQEVVSSRAAACYEEGREAIKGQARLVGNPRLAAAYILVDDRAREGAPDGNGNEGLGGGAYAHDDGVRGYEENEMTIALNGPRPLRWNHAAGGGMVQQLGRRLPAYRHAQFEKILPDLTGCLEAEDINTLGLMFSQESGRSVTYAPSKTAGCRGTGELW